SQWYHGNQQAHQSSQAGRTEPGGENQGNSHPHIDTVSAILFLRQRHASPESTIRPAKSAGRVMPEVPSGAAGAPSGRMEESGGIPKSVKSSRGIAQPTPMETIQPIAGENEQHPDVALVERVRAGDVSAYDELVRKYERQVFRIAQRITQNREDAEDVTQDAFVKGFEKLDQFQGNSKF